MTVDEKLLEITQKLADRKHSERTERENIKGRYKDLDKTKKLTLEQRVRRIEELLNI